MNKVSSFYIANGKKISYVEDFTLPDPKTLKQMRKETTENQNSEMEDNMCCLWRDIKETINDGTTDLSGRYKVLLRTFLSRKCIDNVRELIAKNGYHSYVNYYPTKRFEGVMYIWGKE